MHDDVNLFDARALVRRFAPTVRPAPPTRLLAWSDDLDERRGAGRRIALLDGPLDRAHPDLHTAAIASVDLVGDLDHAPDHHHATRNACLLVGRGRHRFRGLAPDATLLHARVLGRGDALTAGLAWARSERADVVVMPVGADLDDPAAARELDRCAAAGVRLFAAAGNGHPAPLDFPARHPAVVAVGAVDRRGWLHPACSRRPRLDLLAPGGDVPDLDDPHTHRRGTSIACVLAGGLALLEP